MTRRTLSRSGTLIVLVAFIALPGSLMAGQKPASKSTASALPKTSWGDPDLQGTWSGDSAFAIPMQRPEALGVKAELTDQELADKVARDEQARKRALGAVGSFRNDGAWLDKTFRQTSSRSTPDPTSASGFRPIWAIHAATGKATPWWSRRPISMERRITRR
jgi:hypothetical protein